MLFENTKGMELPPFQTLTGLLRTIPLNSHVMVILEILEGIIYLFVRCNKQL